MKTSKRTKISFDIIQRIIKMYESGGNLTNIGHSLSLSPNTIKKYLILNGYNVKTLNIVKKLKSKNDLLIGTYVGIWCGDGSQYKDRHTYTIKICCHSKDIELISFYQKLIDTLFGKKTKIVNEDRNRTLVKFYSKFIFKFVHDYVQFEGNKTHSIRLKQNPLNYSKEFQEGFLLGLMLSDGYLKERFNFNVTSAKLATNLVDILKSFELNPRVYIHNRTKYGWKDLCMISLKKNDSMKCLHYLDSILKKTGYSKGFRKIKGY